MLALSRVRRAFAASVACAVVSGAAMAACGSKEIAAPPGGARPGGQGGEGFDPGGTTTGPPPPDAGGLCGNQIHQAVSDAPNLYFVFDNSGSMAENSGGATKWTRV